MPASSQAAAARALDSAAPGSGARTLVRSTRLGSNKMPRNGAISGMGPKVSPRPQSDVAAVLLAVEADAIDRGIGAGPRRLEVVAERGDAEDAAAGRHHRPTLPRRTGVEHDDVVARGVVE